MEYKIHNIHPYHGKFYYGIPQYFLTKYGQDAHNVLDPFCGSGTTLIEASLAGKKSVGVDINFLSCKISNAKTCLIDIEILKKFYSTIINCEDDTDICFTDSEFWFTKDNYKELCKIYNGISKIKKTDYKNVFEVILSSILKTCCNKRKVWNNVYIADNILPNINSKISIKKMFERKCKAYFQAYQEFNINDRESCIVIEKNILKFKPDNQFDMIITSPPYPFAVDFAKYNRLSYYLFKQDLELAVSKETGARSKRNKKNCIEDFFKEMKKLYLHIMNLVKIGGYACMTVGDTHRNNKNIEFVKWLIKLYTDHGWKLVEDTERELKKQSMPQKRIPIEHILVFKKEKQ